MWSVVEWSKMVNLSISTFDDPGTSFQRTGRESTVKTLRQWLMSSGQRETAGRLATSHWPLPSRHIPDTRLTAATPQHGPPTREALQTQLKSANADCARRSRPSGRRMQSDLLHAAQTETFSRRGETLTRSGKQETVVTLAYASG